MAAWPPLFWICSTASGVRLICIDYLSGRLPPAGFASKAIPMDCGLESIGAPSTAPPVTPCPDGIGTRGLIATRLTCCSGTGFFVTSLLRMTDLRQATEGGVEQKICKNL